MCIVCFNYTKIQIGYKKVAASHDDTYTHILSPKQIPLTRPSPRLHRRPAFASSRGHLGRAEPHGPIAAVTVRSAPQPHVEGQRSARGVLRHEGTFGVGVGPACWRGGAGTIWRSWIEGVCEGGGKPIECVVGVLAIAMAIKGED